MSDRNEPQSDSAAVAAAAQWLHRMRARDEDVKAAIHASFRRTGCTNLGELAAQEPGTVLALYEGMKELVESVEIMERLDDEDLHRRRHGSDPEDQAEEGG